MPCGEEDIPARGLECADSTVVDAPQPIVLVVAESCPLVTALTPPALVVVAVEVGLGVRLEGALLGGGAAGVVIPRIADLFVDSTPNRLQGIPGISDRVED
jgi:hypothetical protein